jgi:N-acetylmuramoyl-L-alanine amidase
MNLPGLDLWMESDAPGKPTRLTLYPISLDTSIENNTDNVNVNSCQAKRVNILNASGQYFRYAIICVLAILLPAGGGTRAIANQPLFEDYKRIIVLDPGHGGQETGARGPDGNLEKAVVLELARLVAVELEREYKVTLTRADDYEVDLVKRTALANHLKADLFISIHTGGSYVHSTAGTLIYYYQGALHVPPSGGKELPLRNKDDKSPILWDQVQNRYLEKSQTLARLISARLSKVKSIEQIRIQGAPLAVLQSADMPAVLIEVGYLTNPAEEKKLRDQRFLRDLALQIRRGIDDFFSRYSQ